LKEDWNGILQIEEHTYYTSILHNLSLTLVSFLADTEEGLGTIIC
jgi:hypothetical protein